MVLWKDCSKEMHNRSFKGTRLGEAFLGHGFHQRRGVVLASSLACPLIRTLGGRARVQKGREEMTKVPAIANDVESARKKWLAASEQASQLSAALFQPGSGYGDPDAKAQDEHRLQTARQNADRLFQEYHDLDRHDMELKMLELQRSQRLATWASFAVAAVVGVATIVSTAVTLLK